MDDNFHSIVKAIMWGRCVFDNIRKFLSFQLTVNVVALALSLVAAISGYEEPLTAVQLLWVNLIMDTLAALALGTELPTESLLHRKPYRIGASLLSKVVIRNILVQAVWQLGILFFILYGSHTMFSESTMPKREKVHYTFVFNVFVFLQLFNMFNSRKVNGEMNVFENIFDNPVFAIIFLICVGLQVIIVELAGPFAQTEGQTWDMWLIAIGFGMTAIPIGHLARMIKVDVQFGELVTPPFAFANTKLDDPLYSFHRPDVSVTLNTRTFQLNDVMAGGGGADQQEESQLLQVYAGPAGTDDRDPSELRFHGVDSDEEDAEVSAIALQRDASNSAPARPSFSSLLSLPSPDRRMVVPAIDSVVASGRASPASLSRSLSRKEAQRERAKSISQKRAHEAREREQHQNITIAISGPQ